MPKLTNKRIRQSQIRMSNLGKVRRQSSQFCNDYDLEQNYRYKNIQHLRQPLYRSVHLGSSERQGLIETEVSTSDKNIGQSIETLRYLNSSRNITQVKMTFDDCVTSTHIEPNPSYTMFLDDIPHKNCSRLWAKRFKKRASTITKSNETDTQKIKKRFEMLADHWRQETDFLSSPKRITDNDNYHSIISLGNQVIPYILLDLKERGGFWYLALRILSGEDPVHHEDRGDIKKMTASWLSWGRKKGYIK
jgi:hypothetical protein